MTRDEIDFELSKDFANREIADKRAKELGSGWHAIKCYRPELRHQGRYQLARDAGGF